MNTYTNILQKMHIEKVELSAISTCVYDIFLSESNTDTDLPEMQLIVSFLEEQSKVMHYLLYNNKLKTREQKSQAITFLSKVIQLKEAFEIAQGVTTLEGIEKAAKTLGPKMQSSFGNE